MHRRAVVGDCRAHGPGRTLHLAVQREEKAATKVLVAQSDADDGEAPVVMPADPPRWAAARCGG